ncbi:MAG: hypothetical protein ACK5C4_13270 [Pseudanabaena sp.]|jgi:hypothetical protein
MEKFIILVSECGSSEESIFWLACPICNRHRAVKIEAIDLVTDEVVALLNPRTQVWVEHSVRLQLDGQR